MHLIVHTMQGQTQDSKELENSPSGRVSQCIEPRSIQLSQACCASHSGRLSSHRRHSRQQRAPISIVDHGCWHFATPNVVIYLKSLVPSFHLFLQVFSRICHQLQLRSCNMSLATGHTTAETCLECLTFQASLKRRDSKKLGI